MAESGRMTRGGLFTHFAERFGIKRAEAGEVLRRAAAVDRAGAAAVRRVRASGGVAKLVVQQRERRMGRKGCYALQTQARFSPHGVGAAVRPHPLSLNRSIM